MNAFISIFSCFSSCLKLNHLLHTQIKCFILHNCVYKCFTYFKIIKFEWNYNLIFSEGVAICGRNCSLTVEWVSLSKIICRTSVGVGKGNIIVITRSGGSGSSTVHFTGLEPKKVGRHSYRACIYTC